MIIAHRGGKPENTLSSFINCAKSGIKAIEFDVHLTSDNKLVVIHDFEINHLKIGVCTLDQIIQESLKLNVELCTLEEVLNAMSLEKDIPLMNIEIKPWNIAEHVATFVKRYISDNNRLCIKDFVFTSFLHTEVLKVRDVIPDARIGFLYRCWPVNILKDLFDNNVDLVVLSECVVNECPSQYVDNLLLNKIDVWCYTVNDFETLLKLKNEYRVSGIITDLAHEFRIKL